MNWITTTVFFLLLIASNIYMFNYATTRATDTICDDIGFYYNKGDSKSVGKIEIRQCFTKVKEGN